MKFNGKVLFDTINELKEKAALQFDKTEEQKKDFKELADMLDKLEVLEKAKEELLTSAPKILKGDK